MRHRLAVPLLLCVLVVTGGAGCGVTFSGPDRAVQRAERELVDLPGVATAAVERDLADSDYYVIGIDVRLDAGASPDQVVAVLKTADKHMAADLGEAGDSISGTVTLPDVDSEVTLRPAPSTSAQVRADRLFAGLAMFGRGLTVSDESLAVALEKAEPADIATAWQRIARDPALRTARYVSVGSKQVPGGYDALDLHSSYGADDDTLRVWQRALALAQDTEDGVVATRLTYSRHEPGTFPASRLTLAIEVDGVTGPPPLSAPLETYLGRFLSALDLLVDESSLVVEAPGTQAILRIYTGPRLSNDPVSGEGRWPAWARGRVG